jgi:hypothetical protein
MTRLFYLEHNMKVLIATSSPTPNVSAFFSKSLAETYAAGAKENIEFLFYWSPDEFSFRNEAAELVITQNFDSVVFVKPHIQWAAEHLISILKKDSLIEGVPTKNYYSPQPFFKTILNNIENEDNPISAKFIDLDLIKIKKEVFSRIDSFIIKANLVKEDSIEQIPLYFYATADENGPVTQDINFCKAVEKAEIPIEVNMEMAIFEHVWVPYKTDLGTEIRKDFVNKGFKQVE